jgi:hypothetical protein
MPKTSIKDLGSRLFAIGEISPFLTWLAREIVAGCVQAPEKADALDIRISDLTAARFVLGPSPFVTPPDAPEVLVMGLQDGDLEPFLDVGWTTWRFAKSKDGIWLQLTAQPATLRCLGNRHLPVSIRIAMPILGPIVQGVRVSSTARLEIRRVKVNDRGQTLGVSSGPALHRIERQGTSKGTSIG